MVQISKNGFDIFHSQQLVIRDDFGPGPGPAWPGPGLSKVIFGVWPTMGLGRIIFAQARPSLWVGKFQRPIGPNCGPWAKFFYVFSKHFEEFHILSIQIDHIT